MIISRRNAIQAGLSLPVLAIVGCGATGGVTLAQVTADVKLVEQVVTEIAPAAIAASGVNSATATKLTGYINTIVADTNTLSSATGLTTATPTVAEIIQIVQAVATIALPLVGLPPAMVPLINTALALLPSISAAIQANLATPAAPLATVTYKAAATLTPEAARAILQSHYKVVSPN